MSLKQTPLYPLHLKHKGKIIDFGGWELPVLYEDMGIIKEHHIPSKYDTPEMSAKINALVKDVNRIIGFENGHVYFQIKIHGDKISLIEFTPRFDGCHMWHLIRYAYGLDLLKVTLECLFEGRSQTLDTYTKRDVSEQFILKFNSDKPGTVVDYANYYVPSDVIYNYWYYNEGECVKTVTGIMEKVGYYIYRCNINIEQ